MTVETIREPAGTMMVLPPETMRSQESDHRVANSLQLISSLLSLQARQASDASVRDALGVAAHRIDAVGSIHRRLHQGGSPSSIDIAPYLFDLAHTIEQGFGGGSACRRVIANVQGQMVPPGFASVLGIMITELVINACKHAYAPGEPGDIQIRLLFPSRTQFRLEVRDFGGTANRRSSAAPGLGTAIINAMCSKLDATFTYLAGGGGTRFLASGMVK